MEIHVQKCQNCKCTNLKNIIYRESGEPDRIYAQCQECEDFVASYVIAPLGYYHNGKGFESFIRGVHRSGEFMSGRRIKQLFLNRQNGEQLAFDKAIGELRAKEEMESSKEQKGMGDGG